MKLNEQHKVELECKLNSFSTRLLKMESVSTCVVCFFRPCGHCSSGRGLQPCTSCFIRRSAKWSDLKPEDLPWRSGKGGLPLRTLIHTLTRSQYLTEACIAVHMLGPYSQTRDVLVTEDITGWKDQECIHLFVLNNLMTLHMNPAPWGKTASALSSNYVI